MALDSLAFVVQPYRYPRHISYISHPAKGSAPHSRLSIVPLSGHTDPKALVEVQTQE